jgi:hypothetical protein
VVHCADGVLWLNSSIVQHAAGVVTLSYVHVHEHLADLKRLHVFLILLSRTPEHVNEICVLKPVPDTTRQCLAELVPELVFVETATAFVWLRTPDLSVLSIA